MAGTAMLATFQQHINDMRSLSLCKICIKPFYEPFILSCGHTYCYSCLASWFGGGQGRKSKKSCPDCRAKVKIQPSPNYLLRDLVHMFIGRAELLPEDETVQEHQKAREEEAVLLAADRAGPGLFKGVFADFGTTFRPREWRQGILDPEDNVLRCPECHWELEDGGCNRCGFHEFDVSGSDSDSDGSIDLNESMEDYDSEMDGEDDLDHEFHASMGAAGFMNLPRDPASRIPTFSSDEDDDDDTEMEQFIDDEAVDGDSGSDDGTASTMTIYNRHFNNQQHGDHDSVSSQASNDGPTPDVPPMPYMYGPQHTETDDSSEAGTNYDEMTEDSDHDDTPVRPARRTGRTAPVVLSSSDDEDDDDDDEADEQEDDEDEEDNDDAVPSAAVVLPDSDSEDSDDSIRPPQSSLQRRQHLNNQRARNRVYNVPQAQPPEPASFNSSRQSHRARGGGTRYQPYPRAGPRITVGGPGRDAV